MVDMDNRVYSHLHDIRKCEWFFFDNFFNVIYRKSSGASLIEGITRVLA